MLRCAQYRRASFPFCGGEETSLNARSTAQNCPRTVPGQSVQKGFERTIFFFFLLFLFVRFQRQSGLLEIKVCMLVSTFRAKKT